MGAVGVWGVGAFGSGVSRVLVFSLGFWLVGFSGVCWVLGGMEFMRHTIGVWGLWVLGLWASMASGTAVPG